MSPTTANQLNRRAATDFAHALVEAVLNRLLNARDHALVRDSLATLIQRLARCAELGIELPLRLQFGAHRIHHDGVPLDGPSLQARSLLDRCSERGISVLSFGAALDVDEANRLLDLLLLPEHREAFDRQHRDATLQRHGIRNVGVSLLDPADPTDRNKSLDELGSALQQYQQLAEALQENHRLAHRDLELAVDVTSTAVERALLEFDEPSMLLSLSMQDDVDSFTVGHSVRVALLALQVARECGADRNQLVRVGAAALMHDIGKSKVPQEILFKRGRLDQDEWQWMAQHPRLGAQILLEQHDEVDPAAVGAAFCHHMGPDGAGYPEPMLPIAPSEISRLIRVCDVFEALTAVRPYKHALTPIEAYAVMLRNACDFDGNWLRRFVRTLGLFPTGTRLELEDGTAALVVAQTEDLRRPRIRLVSAADGAALADGHPTHLRVGDQLHGETVRIASVHSHDRELPLPPLLDSDDSDTQGCGGAHDACLPERITRPGRK